MTAVTGPAENPAEWLPDPMVDSRRIAQASRMVRTRRDVPLLGHVRLAMSRRDLRLTAPVVRGAQDERAGIAAMARWENEGGALMSPKDREPLIGVHDTTSP
jgi:sensor c-di-GMP phosphodiesterase-like protein